MIELNDINENKDKKFNIKFNSETAFRILTILVWVRYTLLPFATAIISRIPIIDTVSQYIMPIVIGVFIVLSLSWFLKNVKIYDVIFYIVFLLVILLTMLFYPKNAVYIESDLWRIVGLALPMFFMGIAFKYDVVKKDLYWASLISVILLFLYQLYFLVIGRELLDDNMNAAYNILPSVLYLILWAFASKKIICFVWVFIGAMLLFIFGTRGPILAFIVFLLLMVFIKILKMKNSIKQVICIAICLLIAYFLLCTDIMLEIATKLSKKFSDIGFSTRVFDYFINGDISDDNGRNYLAEKVINAISLNPLGYGLMGDRVVLDIYVHNIVLEMLCDFGLVLGSIIIFVIVLLPIFSLIKNKNIGFSHFILMIFSMVLIKLMLSGSFITEPYFYFMLGISINGLRNKGKAEI